MKVARWIACLAPLACLLLVAAPAHAGGWNRGACQSRTYFGWPGQGGGEFQNCHNRNPWSPFTGKFLGVPFCCCTPEEKYQKFLRQYQIAQARYQVAMNRLCWSYYNDYLNGGCNNYGGECCNCNPYCGSCKKCCGLGIKSKFACLGCKLGCKLKNNFGYGPVTECDSACEGCQDGFCPVSEIPQDGYGKVKGGYPQFQPYQGHARNATEGMIAGCRREPIPIKDESEVCSCCKMDYGKCGGFHLKGLGLKALGPKCEPGCEDGLLPRMCNQVKACKACKGGSCGGFGCGHGGGAMPPPGAGPYGGGGCCGAGNMGAYPGMNREDALRYIEGFMYYPPYQLIRSPRDHFMFDAKYNIGGR